MSNKKTKSKSKDKKFEVDISIHASGQEPQQRKKVHHKDLIQYQPLTDTQKRLFDTFRNYKDKHLSLIGSAGTGKTFCALFLALDELLNNEQYEKIIIIRSAVSSRDIGFLPGDQQEKGQVYELPYIGICDEMFEFSKSYETLKKLGKIEFQLSSFLRGTTFSNSIIIVDEAQNMSFQEADTIITRTGQNSKVIIVGDIKQNDLVRSKYDQSGFNKLYEIIVNMDSFEIIEFNHDDIVRSGFVKEYIITKEKTGY